MINIRQKVALYQSRSTPELLEVCLASLVVLTSRFSGTEVGAKLSQGWSAVYDAWKMSPFQVYLGPESDAPTSPTPPPTEETIQL